MIIIDNRGAYGGGMSTSSHGGGIGYTNTSKDRIKDTLAKA